MTDVKLFTSFFNSNLQLKLFGVRPRLSKTKPQFVEGHLNEVNQSFDQILEFQPGLDWFNVT